jgi:hypothetical protein
MARIAIRFFCLLALAFAFTACGAESGSPTNLPEATIPATWTDSAPTPDTTPELDTPLNPEPTASGETLPEPTIDPGNPADTPVIIPTDAAGSTAAPTINPSGTAINPARTIDILCDDSQFIEDVTIPDGTVVKPGEEFKKTWRIKNTGICSWTTKYAIGYAYGEKMHGTETKLTKTVSPGATVDVTIKFTAPMMKNCWYGSWWRLKNAIGDYFGDFVYVSILISDGIDNTTICPTQTPAS